VDRRRADRSAVVLLALGVGLLSAAIATGQLVGWLLGLLIVLAGGLGGIAAVGAVQARYRRGPVEAELSTQIGVPLAAERIWSPLLGR